VTSQDFLADDPNHPIPNTDAIDVHAVWKTGGSSLGVVIATPLQADERSQARLIRKMEIYLSYAISAEYAADYGPLDPTTTSIDVNIHPKSSQVVFQILEDMRSWVGGNNVTLNVKLLET
jgi:hypothetical protein